MANKKHIVVLTGAGISADLQRSIDANREARSFPIGSGRATGAQQSDQDIFLGAKSGIDVFQNILNKLSGLDIKDVADRTAPGQTSFGSDGSTHIDLNVRQANFGGELESLVTKFEEVTSIELQNAVSTINADLTRIWGFLRTLPGRGVPQTAPSAGGP